MHKHPALAPDNRRRVGLAGIAAATLTLAAIAPAHADTLPDPLPVSTASVSTVQTFPDFGTCHTRPGAGGQLLPDARCTPGALSIQGASATAAARICAPGWARSQQGSAKVYEQERRHLAAAYGTSELKSRDTVVDQVVPVELGGAPNDARNLWLQTRDAAARKGKVEAELVAAVCDGRMKLELAQHLIADDWTRVKIVHEVGEAATPSRG